MKTISIAACGAIFSDSLIVRIQLCLNETYKTEWQTSMVLLWANHKSSIMYYFRKTGKTHTLLQNCNFHSCIAFCTVILFRNIYSLNTKKCFSIFVCRTGKCSFFSNVLSLINCIVITVCKHQNAAKHATIFSADT